MEEYGDEYCMLGRLSEGKWQLEVKQIAPESEHIATAIHKLEEGGFKTVHGRWLIDGYPKVILFDLGSGSRKMNDWKQELYERCQIGVPHEDTQSNDAVIFGFMVAMFLKHFLDSYRNSGYRSLIYHQYCMERVACHMAHVFTTVSEITGIEAEHLIHQEPDILTPNGLNVVKFAALHEFQTEKNDNYYILQNSHALAKEKINNFIRGHFHGHYDFDLDKTIYIDRVKVIFHPEFLSSVSPLIGLDYEEFVRGCHIGVFPSYYEPWGYTPAECTVMGVPSVSTNLSGFGCFMRQNVEDAASYGVYVIDRRFKDCEGSVRDLAQVLYDFCGLSRRQRIIMRNRTERLSELLDWRSLGVFYRDARRMALERLHPNLDEIISNNIGKVPPISQSRRPSFTE
ncbi:unnamed protein product [Litomosoides sigmodontis]|uniref:Glycogen [starch] synthase n=1 Tax=Litomosoides sigmodontis TaxID=42156 RepID=A0A3P6TSB3_LITSI|nr:unnamed protein product [Litomosoides sigmodontis]